MWCENWGLYSTITASQTDLDWDKRPASSIVIVGQHEIAKVVRIVVPPINMMLHDGVDMSRLISV